MGVQLFHCHFLLEGDSLPLLRTLRLHRFATKRQWLHNFLVACPSVELLELTSVMLLDNDWFKFYINLKDAIHSIAELRFNNLVPKRGQWLQKDRKKSLKHRSLNPVNKWLVKLDMGIPPYGSESDSEYDSEYDSESDSESDTKEVIVTEHSRSNV